jgi:fumarylacetoacetate (FAA) hydrolase family protein
MTLAPAEAFTAVPDWFGTAAEALPDDADDSVLIGRIWDPAVGGPSPVVVRGGDVLDASARYPTIRDSANCPRRRP